jgi:cytochrome b561
LHALAEARQSDLTQVLLQIHRSFGLTIWVVTVLRLAWRLTNATLPPFPAHMTMLHRATVKLCEYGLYALLLGQPATGLLTTIFSGRPFSMFLWVVSPIMPRDDILRGAFHLAHEVGAWTLAALVLSHAAAALFHHFVLRDDVLECMAPAARRRGPSGGLVAAHSITARNAFEE